MQFPQASIEDIDAEQLRLVYDTNIFPAFLPDQGGAAPPQAGERDREHRLGDRLPGAPVLLDYSSTKGAVVSFTRSLSLQLAPRGIRVNAIAPGPVWTSLIASSYDSETVSTFGTETPMKRPAQPFELAPAYVYLASNIMSSFVSGTTIHVNGGIITGA